MGLASFCYQLLSSPVAPMSEMSVEASLDTGEAKTLSNLEYLGYMSSVPLQSREQRPDRRASCIRTPRGFVSAKLVNSLLSFRSLSRSQDCQTLSL